MGVLNLLSLQNDKITERLPSTANTIMGLNIPIMMYRSYGWYSYILALKLELVSKESLSGVSRRCGKSGSRAGLSGLKRESGTKECSRLFSIVVCCFHGITGSKFLYVM